MTEECTHNYGVLHVGCMPWCEKVKLTIAIKALQEIERYWVNEPDASVETVALMRGLIAKKSLEKIQ